MRANFQLLRRVLWRARLLGLLGVAWCHSLSAQYVQVNLVSDLPGFASVTDTNLMGAWGMAHSPTGPWSVTTTFGGVAVVVNGAGEPLPRVVTIPQVMPIYATGIDFNGGAGFQVAANLPAHFLLATLNGTVLGWSPSQPDPTVAVIAVNHFGTAGYSGLSLAQTRGQDFLYVANFRQNRVDVFDANFNPVTLWPGAFKDNQIPSSLSVFNVQAIGNLLYVTYAATNVFTGGLGPGRGFVSVFNLNGALVRGLQYGYWMNDPWGVVQAPANFGHLSNRLLVGMFGSGVIAAFDATNGQFIDFLRNRDALPLIISRGLWELEFGNGAAAGPADTLYFATDFQFGSRFHGLIGTITPLRIE
jgi:uncharacterized protein (TIGR03118 family)